jgi:hypothetical protein
MFHTRFDRPENYPKAWGKPVITPQKLPAAQYSIDNDSQYVSNGDQYPSSGPWTVSLSRGQMVELGRLTGQPGDIVSFTAFYTDDQKIRVRAVCQVVEKLPSGKLSPAPIPPMPRPKLEIFDKAKDAWISLPLAGQPGYPYNVKPSEIYAIRVGLRGPKSWGDYERLGYPLPDWELGPVGHVTTTDREDELNFTARTADRKAGGDFLVKVSGPVYLSTKLHVSPEP